MFRWLVRCAAFAWMALFGPVLGFILGQRLIGVDTIKLAGPEIAKIMDDLRGGFEGGHLRPSPVQTWTLDQGIDAYAAVEKGATSSKHVLLPRRS